MQPEMKCRVSSRPGICWTDYISHLSQDPPGRAAVDGWMDGVTHLFFLKAKDQYQDIMHYATTFFM